MKLSQSLQDSPQTEYAISDTESSLQNRGVTAKNSDDPAAGKARVVFIDIAGSDVARIFFGLPSDICEVTVIDDADEAVNGLVASVPDLVVCPRDAWCCLAERVSDALSRLCMHRPVLVLLCPAASATASAEVDVSRLAARTMHQQLLQSIRRVIRLLSETRGTDAAPTIALADITLDPVSRRVTRGGRNLRLSQTTFHLLQILMAEPERVHTREELLRYLRGDRIHVAIRTIDVHIKRLRSELNTFGGPDVIRTVRGVGYSFSQEPGWTG